MTRRVIKMTSGEFTVKSEVWILGGSGRTGRSVAADLAGRGVRPVLVGRDEGRLNAAAADTGWATRVAESADAMSAAIEQHRPAVVVNTVGPFARTAAPIVSACLVAGSHYLDLANDVAAFLQLLDRHEAARTAGTTLITGAGFGVTATESVVVALCTDRPDAAEVRVDMVPSLELVDGAVGDALAGTMVEGLPGIEGGGRYSGRRYRNGRLTSAPLAGEVQRLQLPDGDWVTTSTMPLGELVAAQRASRAPSVISASSELPAATFARLGMRFGAPLLAFRPLRNLVSRRLAGVRFTARPMPRPHSWGHALITWPDGTSAEGWLRVGDAQAFTVSVTAEVAYRLLDGQGRPGAYTPAALFGTGLAESCGGTYLLNQPGNPGAPTPILASVEQ